MKLGLGTAQFGLDYGITNARGRVPEIEIRDILVRASAGRIDTIDTASLYGEAESVLGRTLWSNHEFRIVSKTPKLDSPGSGSFADRVEAAFADSRRNLGSASIHGLLFHRASDLLTPEGAGAWKVVERLRDEGLVTRIGASISDIAIGEDVAARHPLDIVQVPINILDRRALQNGFVQRLKERGVEIHARSPFLQGVLATSPDGLPAFLDRTKSHLRHLGSALKSNGLTMIEGALRYVLELPVVDRVIVGVTSVTELARLIEIAGRKPITDFDFGRWHLDDIDMIDPTRWPAKV